MNNLCENRNFDLFNPLIIVVMAILFLLLAMPMWYYYPQLPSPNLDLYIYIGLGLLFFILGILLANYLLNKDFKILNYSLQNKNKFPIKTTPLT